jgi:hypothetical protein
VRWQGQETGSGIAGYDLWVSEDGGPLQPWLAGVTLTQANYTARPGHTYGFAARARDRAGNEGLAPAQIEVTTQVVDGWPVSGFVLGLDNLPAPNVNVVISGSDTRESLTTDARGFWGPVKLLADEYTFQAGTPEGNDPAWPAPRRLMIDASTSLTLTLAPPVNAVLAGDFEGDQVWTVWDWTGEVNRSIDTFDGQFGVRLGDGTGEPAACPQGEPPGQVWAVQQKITVPVEAPRLTFMHKISTTQTGGDQGWLEVDLGVGNQQSALISPGELWQTTDWQLASIDLSAWRSQTVNLEFRVIRCSEQALRVTIDRVSIGE